MSRAKIKDALTHFQDAPRLLAQNSPKPVGAQTRWSREASWSTGALSRFCNVRRIEPERLEACILLKSAAGPAHSKTCRACRARVVVAKRLGVREICPAFRQAK